MERMLCLKYSDAEYIKVGNNWGNTDGSFALWEVIKDELMALWEEIDKQSWNWGW